MAQYNPRYDTKVQPFNISIIKEWTRKKDLKELQQWLDEGEPHKRLLKESIYNATIDQWLDGIKILFEKDWISLDSKIKEVISKIHFCKKDDVWIFIRDIVFSDKKLIKKHSFPLFWAAWEKGKKELFDENKVDFSHSEAESTLIYRYISKEKEYLFGRKAPNNKGLNELEKNAMDYLLSKPVYIEPYFFIDNLNNNSTDYLINILSKRGNNQLFRNKHDLFVVACVAGVYFQSMINHLIYCNKSDEEINIIIKQQSFIMNLFINQAVDFEFNFTDKFLEKNQWINYRLEESFGDLAPYRHRGFIYGSLDLKYNRSNSMNVLLPKSQKVKLAWYWIGGELSKSRVRTNDKYIMTNDDKKYAETEFQKFLKP